MTIFLTFGEKKITKSGNYFEPAGNGHALR